MAFLISTASFLWEDPQNFDLHFAARGTQDQLQEYLIIDSPELHLNTEDESVEALYWKTLLTKLLKSQPKAIVVTNTWESHPSANLIDHIESKAIFSNPHIAWAIDLDTWGRPVRPQWLTAIEAQTGFKHLREDDDGIVRRFLDLPYKSIRTDLAHLTAQIIKADHELTHNQQSDSIPTAQDQTLKEQIQSLNRWHKPNLINFSAPPGTIKTIQANEVLFGKFNQELFFNKIILIGSLASNTEQLQTPLGKMSRPEVIANQINQVVKKTCIKKFPKYIYVLEFFVLFIVLSLALLHYPQSFAFIFILFLFILTLSLSTWLFDKYYIWMPLQEPALQMALTYILFLSYQVSRNEQRAWRLEQERKVLFEVEEIKNNFVSMMSHDLKTPIAKMQAITDRLLHLNSRKEQFKPETISSDLRNLRRAIEDLHRYIQSILRVTRVEASDFKISKEVIDINEQIVKVLFRLKHLASEKQIKIDSHLEPIFSIEADPTLIQEVLQNLIENAIKYSPQNSHIWITSEERGDNVHVTVLDTGVGIPPDDLQKVWGKFSRGRSVPPESKGTGLGLYFVKFFVELHGGEVFMESHVGQGTKVGFSIPVSSQSSAILSNPVLTQQK